MFDRSYVLVLYFQVSVVSDEEIQKLVAMGFERVISKLVLDSLLNLLPFFVPWFICLYCI